MTRRIIVYIATSADGYIARANGSVDWLDRPRIRGDYDMAKFLRSIDTILWGRKTYEQALGFSGGTGIGKNIRNCVFSSQAPGQVTPGVECVTDPVGTFAHQLRARKGKDIWMMGGAGIIGSFLDAGEIDEFMIHVVPTIIGEGIPLIAPRHRNVPLRLRSTKRFSDGVVRLHYEVVGRGRRTGAKAAGRQPGRVRT